MTPTALTPPQTPPTTTKPLLTLTDPTHWTYLTRGANNILYSYTPPPTSSIPSLHHHLLRLRIACPGTPSATFLHNALHTRYLPNLPDRSILDTQLVRLGDGFIAGLQGGLAELQAHFEGFGIEGSPGRRRKGKVVRLDEQEEYGLLVEDMRLPHGSGGDWDEVPVGRGERARGGAEEGDKVEVKVALVEFKPKYLSQSADAPEGWSVCRTCAYRAKVGCGAKDPPGEMYCPLDLASGERGRVERAVGCVVGTRGCSSRVDVNYWGLRCLGGGEVGKEEMDREVRRFLRKCLTEHFLTSETRKFIEASARLQKEWGRAGVFPSSSMADDIDPEGIWYALGLVDCTIYMRVSIRVPLSVANERLDLPALFESCKDDVRIECKVGDLDPKVGTGAQGVFFKNQERSLSRGGWYFGEEGTRSCRDGRRIERK